MAELVGVVPSGISIGTLAAQIAASLTKLKSYWDQVKEAPEEIASLVEEIEDLYLLLAEIEDDQHRNPISSLLLDGASASRCLDHCKRGADRLNELTEELALDIEHSSRVKRKWAAVKVVLKKDKLEKYKSKLERTIRLLTLSHQCYTRALLQLQPDIIVSRLKEVSTPSLSSHSAVQQDTQVSTTTISSLTHTSTRNISSRRLCRNVEVSNFWIPFGSIQYEKSVPIQSTSRKDGDDFQERQDTHYTLRATLRGPVSFLNRFWMIQGLNAQHKWTFTIRNYNIIPDDSLVIKYAYEDNNQGIKELFSQRKASPHDVTRNGHSLLHIAAARANVELCSIMIDNGAEVDPVSNLWSPMDHAVQSPYLFRPLDLTRVTNTIRPLDLTRLTDTIRLLIQNGSPLPKYLYLYHGSSDGFKFLAQHMDTHYSQWSIAKRLNFAMCLIEGAPKNKPDLIHTFLGQELMKLSAAIATNGTTLLHALANTICIVTAFWYAGKKNWRQTKINDFELKQYAVDLEGWRKLLRDLIHHSPDLHVISSWKRTPFLYLFEDLWSYYGRYSYKAIPMLLKMWLEDMREAGVDLKIYGEVERRLLKQELNRDMGGWDGPYDILWRLIDFEYGDSPEDWHIWVSNPYDQAVGEFWRMVEPSDKQTMPGAWIDDEDNED